MFLSMNSLFKVMPVAVDESRQSAGTPFIENLELIGMFV